MVIASDGVWEFLSNEEIMNFVIPFYKTMNATGASEKLVDESLKTWHAVRISDNSFYRKTAQLMI